MRVRPVAGTGFTLVEVLIALVLLSLLMLMLTGALRSLGQTEERVEQRVAAADDLRITAGFLGDVMGRISARTHREMSADRPTQVPFFEARPDSLAWVGVMPARFGLGGRHYMRLAVEPSAGGGRLVLRYAPWTGAAVFSAWEGAAAQTLATPARAISLRYQEPMSGNWSTVWPPEVIDGANTPLALLPSAIELQVEGPEPSWPPLVVAVLPTRAGSLAAQGATFGGGRRR